MVQSARTMPRTMHAMEPTINDLEGRLREAVEAVGPCVVALSGGVDSSLVAAAAARFLPPGAVLAATADSASLAEGELEICASIASALDIEWTAAATDELADDRYLRNDSDRCFWCKTALMDQLLPLAEARGATVVLGVNVDDLGDHRPGQRAAAERGARFPLVDAGFSKTDIRRLARHWQLEVWDRPAMPCLSSRIPYGTPVSVALLSRIDRAEAAIRAMGFVDVRVRDYDDTARIELPPADLPAAVANHGAIVEALTAVGYDYVTLDLAGLRSGNLNGQLARAGGMS